MRRAALLVDSSLLLWLQRVEPSMDAKKLLVDKAKELAALATARGVRLPAGTDGLGRAANALNTTKNGAEFDLVRLETRCVASAL